MKFLPFEDITYRTHLDSEEILKRLHEITEPRKTFRMKGIFGSEDHKPYEGSISGNSFDLTRIIGYRNSFLPVITGTVEDDPSGTRIYVKMRLHPIVMAFLAIWIGIVGIGCIIVFVSFLSSQKFEPMSLILVGMLIFGYIMPTGGFKFESAKTRKFFGGLFEAEIEKDTI